MWDWVNNLKASRVVYSCIILDTSIFFSSIIPNHLQPISFFIKCVRIVEMGELIQTTETHFHFIPYVIDHQVYQYTGFIYKKQKVLKWKYALSPFSYFLQNYIIRLGNTCCIYNYSIFTYACKENTSSCISHCDVELGKSIFTIYNYLYLRIIFTKREIVLTRILNFVNCDDRVWTFLFLSTHSRCQLTLFLTRLLIFSWEIYSNSS